MLVCVLALYKCVCLFVCERKKIDYMFTNVCMLARVYVCVCVKERKREHGRMNAFLLMQCLCVSVCVRKKYVYV